MTLLASKTGPTAGILLLGGLTGFVLFARAEAGPAGSFTAPSDHLTSRVLASATHEVAQGARAAIPPFVYASGAQGVGYYANPATRAATGVRSAPAPTFSSGARGQSVGPGVRDWTTGRRGRLHKPWLQPR